MTDDDSIPNFKVLPIAQIVDVRYAQNKPVATLKLRVNIGDQDYECVLPLCVFQVDTNSNQKIAKELGEIRQILNS